MHRRFPGSFLVLDRWSSTVSRPEKSTDGTHYGNGLNAWRAPSPRLVAIPSQQDRGGCSCFANGLTLQQLWEGGNYSKTAGTTMVYERQTAVLHAHMLLNMILGSGHPLTHSGVRPPKDCEAAFRRDGALDCRECACHKASSRFGLAGRYCDMGREPSCGCCPGCKRVESSGKFNGICTGG